MGQIIRLLMTGRMNIRRWIVWIFIVFLMVTIGRIAIAVADAVEAVSAYSVAHPESWSAARSP